METIYKTTERDRLIEEHLGLAELLAAQKNRTTPSNIALDDLRSVAFLALVEAAHKYNGNSHTFRSYAAIRIRGEIIDYIRSMCWGTRGNYSPIVSLDQEINDEGFTLGDMIADYRRPEYIPEFSTVDHLSQFAKEVISLYYVEGLTQKEIGERLGISHSKVSKLLDKYKQSISERRKNVA
jgi:RNA polymerase sigma factor for flagellar operon FliA